MDETRTCAECGESVYRYGRRPNAARPPRFCSDKCRSNANNARRGTLEYCNRNCVICGTSFRDPKMLRVAADYLERARALS